MFGNGMKFLNIHRFTHPHFQQTNRCISLGSLGVLKKYSDNCQPSDVINYLIDVDRICDEVGSNYKTVNTVYRYTTSKP